MIVNDKNYPDASFDFWSEFCLKPFMAFMVIVVKTVSKMHFSSSPITQISFTRETAK